MAEPIADNRVAATAVEPSTMRREWRHRDGDTYMPVFGDWFGNDQDGFNHHWSRLADPTGTLGAAKHAGFRSQGSDDFNIAVVRCNRVVALLWMREDMAEEQHVLDQITEELIAQ